MKRYWWSKPMYRLLFFLILASSLKVFSQYTVNVIGFDYAQDGGGGNAGRCQTSACPDDGSCYLSASHALIGGTCTGSSCSVLPDRIRFSESGCCTCDRILDNITRNLNSFNPGISNFVGLLTQVTFTLKYTPIIPDLPNLSPQKAAYCPGDVISITTPDKYPGRRRQYIFEAYYGTTLKETFVWTQSSGTPAWDYTVPSFDAAAPSRTFKVKIKGIASASDNDPWEGPAIESTPVFFSHSPPTVDVSATAPVCRDGNEGSIILNITSGFVGQSITRYDSLTNTNKSSTLDFYTLGLQRIGYNIPYSNPSRDNQYTNQIYSLDGLTPTSLNHKLMDEVLLPGGYHYKLSNFYSDLGNRCYIEGEITIPQPYQSLTLSATAADKKHTDNTDSGYHINCNGGSDGQINTSLIMTNNDNSITSLATDYVKVNGNPFATASPSGLAASPTLVGYTLIGYSANNCASDPLTGVMVNQPPVVTVASPTHPNYSSYNNYDIDCKGNATGTIQTSASGGYGRGYQYNWNNEGFQSSATWGNRTAGTGFTVKTRDEKGCESSYQSFDITEPTALSITGIKRPADFGSPPSGQMAYNGYDVRCHNTDDGYVEVVSSGGVTGYTYSSNNINYLTNPIFTSLPQNTPLTFYVRDANGCTTSAGITLNIIPPALSVTGIVKALYNGYNISCNNAVNTLNGGDFENGAVTISGAGGVFTKEYDFTLKDAPNFSYATSIAHNTTFTGLETGIHEFELKDNNNCILPDTFYLNQPPRLRLLGYDPHAPACKGYTDGYVNFNAQGGVPSTYNYTLVGQSIFYQPPTYPLYNVATVNVNLVRFPNIFKDDYDLHIVDQNFCSFDTTVSITEPDLLSITGLSGTIACKGDTVGNIIASVTGGNLPYTYIWATTSNSDLLDSNTILPQSTTAGISGLSKSQTYSLHLTDANHCTNSGNSDPPKRYLVRSVNLVEPQTYIRFNQSYLSQPLCYGLANGSIQMRATGGWEGFSYSESGTTFTGNGLFRNLTTGSYRYYVKDRNGCLKDTSFFLPQPEPLALYASATDARCYDSKNGMVSLTASGGSLPYHYELAKGNLNLEIETENTLTGFNGLTIGSYVPSLTDKNNCSITGISLLISQPEALQLTVGKTDAICGSATGTAFATVSGGTFPYQYQWLNPQSSSTVIGQLFSGSYTVKVTDVQDCTIAGTAIVVDKDGPVVAGTLLSPTSCAEKADGVAAISITSLPASKFIAQYQWQSPDNSQTISSTTATATGLAAFKYITGIAKDNDGCRGAANIYVSGPAPLLVSLTGIDPTCFRFSNGQILSFTEGGTAPYTYQWNDSLSQTAATAINLKAYIDTTQSKKYKVKVTDKKLCTTTDSATISNPVEIKVDLGKDTLIVCVGQQVTIDARNPALNHAWTADNGFSSAAQSITVNRDGLYEVAVSNAKGCTTTDKFRLITSASLLTASFASIDTIYATDTVRLAEISWPAPDSVIWQLPRGLRILNNANLNLTRKEKEYVYLIADSAGVYNIGMAAYLGECADKKTKELAVKLLSDKPANRERWGYQGIKSYQAYPNPTTGILKLIIELTTEQSLDISIYNAMSELMHHAYQSGQSHYENDLNLEAFPAGIYAITLSTPGSQKLIRVVKE